MANDEWRVAKGECGPSHSVSDSVSLSFTNLKSLSKILENGECWGSILGRAQYADSRAVDYPSNDSSSSASNS